MTAKQRYPNTKPRVLSSDDLAREGKCVVGADVKHDAFGYVFIATLDGNGINELHLMWKEQYAKLVEMNR